jgi:hypothetical protein
MFIFLSLLVLGLEKEENHFQECNLSNHKSTSAEQRISLRANLGLFGGFLSVPGLNYLPECKTCNSEVCFLLNFIWFNTPALFNAY